MIPNSLHGITLGFAKSLPFLWFFIFTKEFTVCILNIVGFYHEQSRIDRDKYVEILWRNIKPGRQDQFHKYDPSKAKVPGGAPYDTCSVMHYLSNAFAKVCMYLLVKVAHIN